MKPERTRWPRLLALCVVLGSLVNLAVAFGIAIRHSLEYPASPWKTVGWPQINYGGTPTFYWAFSPPENWDGIPGHSYDIDQIGSRRQYAMGSSRGRPRIICEQATL